MPRHPSVTDQNPFPEADAKHKATGPSETTDYSRVIIENLGQVAFDQAFNMLKSAPKEALTAWTCRLEGLPVGPRRTAGITAFFKTLAQIDAATAIDLALSMKRREPRWNAIGSISSATPSADLNQVARMFIALNEKKLSLTDLVTGWSRSDPAATARFLSNYSGDVDNRDVAQLMANWAALDPMAATEWLTQRDSFRRDETVCAAFYSGWLEHDRAAALNDLRIRAGDTSFDKGLEHVSKDLFKLSQDEARTFILTLSPAAQKTAVGSIYSDVTSVYLSGAPDLQGDEVAKWLITLPENLWHETIGEVLNRWPEEHVVERNIWMDQLPPDKRDAVLADYCRAVNWYMPTDNIRAGLKIRDPNLRRQALHKAFEEMEGEQRRQALTDTGLSPDESRELAKILKQP